MATFTTNYNLKKPSQEDFYNVDDFNGNMDILDEEIGSIASGGNNNATEIALLTQEVDAVAQGVTAHLADDVKHVTQANKDAWNSKAEGNHNHSGVYEPVLSKNTAFNKNFGTTSGTVCQGNDSRLSNSRPANGGNSDTVDGKHATDFVNAVAVGSTTDPNTTQESYVLTNHANSPGLGAYWHIRTLFYSSKTGNRSQVATRYNGGTDEMYIRSCYSGTWTSWKRVWHSGNVSSSIPTRIYNGNLQYYDGGWKDVGGTMKKWTPFTKESKVITGTQNVYVTALSATGKGFLSWAHLMESFEFRYIKVVIDGTTIIESDGYYTTSSPQYEIVAGIYNESEFTSSNESLSFRYKLYNRGLIQYNDDSDEGVFDTSTGGKKIIVISEPLIFESSLQVYVKSSSTSGKVPVKISGGVFQ